MEQDSDAEPPRAEKRETPSPAEAGHVRGVEATPGGLVRATLASAAAAGALLLFAWLPAEYGIDPTGVGGLLGLTEMGEIKQQLYAEAAAENAGGNGGPAISNSEIAERLSAIENQVAAIAAVVGVRPVTGAVPAAAGDTTPAAAGNATLVEEAATPSPAEPSATTWRDEVSYTLGVGEGMEVKLAMAEGAVAEFEWTANGAVLNHDTHGAGGGKRITYERGRGVAREEGELVAAFTGKHGWFWRNRTEAPVTFTLRTRGEYQGMIAP